MESFSGSFADLRSCDAHFRENFQSHEVLFLAQAQRNALNLEIYLGSLSLYRGLLNCTTMNLSPLSK